MITNNPTLCPQCNRRLLSRRDQSVGHHICRACRKSGPRLPEMTAAEFDAALARTRMSPEGPAARGARMVLVDAAYPGDAAEAVGRTRTTIVQAVGRLRRRQED
ncbi:MAG: transcriptional regulator KorA [Nitrospirota bacterium]|nr:transcriptional regulator KorA [Nitrospirota bacterium]